MIALAIDTDLVVRRHGRDPAEAATLLLLHGLTDSGAAWPDALERWSPHYAIITVDQRGHGDSPRFTAEQLTAHPGEVMVDDLVALLEQLTDPPVVIGHSLGGAVALAAGVRRPALVRALILEDPAPRKPGEPQLDTAKGQLFFNENSAMQHLSPDGFDAYRERHPTWSATEFEMASLAKANVDLEYLRGGDFRPVTAWPDLFSVLEVPTLVVSGDNLDEVYADAEIEQGIERLGNHLVTLVRVPGAAHCVRREQPEAFYLLVKAWLTDIRPISPLVG